VPLRRPVELAHRVLTTHLACGGRLRLGVGAGSTAADFAAVGVDFDARFRELAHSLATMRQLWTGARVGAAELGAPWPVAAGGPPVLVGSWAGSRWIERAAKEFDGWIGSGARSSWRLIREGIERFRGFGGPRAVVEERLRHVRSLGFDDLVLVPARHDRAHLEELRALV
jgi:alkanesulfonate monooxygenase SsuD/methylene tetrahydromethanopterin reductase-like flavin-dependent oxidoreductase (luciferase family)